MILTPLPNFWSWDIMQMRFLLDDQSSRLKIEFFVMKFVIILQVLGPLSLK